MTNQKPFVLVSKRVVTATGIKHLGIQIEHGFIAKLLSPSNLPTNVTVEDVGDLVIMPGLIDVHVHINEPGRTEWEGFESATKAAAAGGLTTLVEMPLNSSPVTTTVEAFNTKLNATKGKLWIDCGFYGGVIPDNAKELAALARAGVLGFKAFMVHSGIDDFPNATERDLRKAMPIIADLGLPLLLHAELEGEKHTDHNNPKSYHSYLNSRPPAWELNAIKLAINLCREFRCRTHIVHLATAEALPLLRQAKDEGLPLSVETCPHYLFFSAEKISDGDTRYKCAPPIRQEQNRQALWGGLEDGTIDFIATDHSPCTEDLKLLSSGDFERAWGGIAGLQFMLPAVWSKAKERGVSISKLAEWLCTKPATLVGLEKTKGLIAPGYEANITVWNPDQTFTVEKQEIYHRNKITPYEAQTLCGTVGATYLRGELAYKHRDFSATPNGQVVLNPAHA